MNGLGIPVGLVVEVYKVGSGIYNNIRKKEDEKFDNEYAKRKAEIESLKVKVNGYDTDYNAVNNVYTVLTPEVVSYKRSLPNSHSRGSSSSGSVFIDENIASQIREFLKPYQFYIDTNTKQITPVYPEAATKVWGTDESGNRVITSSLTTNNSSSNKKKVNIIIIAVAAIAATYLIFKD